MTVEEVKIELEKVISSLTSSGFDNIDSVIVKKLDGLTASAGGLSMKEGKRLIENLVNEMKSDKAGETKIKSCNTRLVALDFYVKKLSDIGNIEDY